MTSTAIRILFVDDERNVLNSLQRLFMEEEYEIFTAASGQEGLEALEHAGPFQLIVSDFRMPSMNGVEFLSEVCRRWPETERMILSGYADTVAIVAAINEGQIYKFIAKPWNDDELLRTVREALDRHDLKERNRRLVAELSATNAELNMINDHLNILVDERVTEILMQSRALNSFQTVLDVLPIGFIGADRYGMIVQCNRLGAEMFNLTREDLIGNDLATTLPAVLVQMVVQLDKNACCVCAIDLPWGRCNAHMTRICHDQQHAIVIALMHEKAATGGRE